MRLPRGPRRSAARPRRRHEVARTGRSRAARDAPRSNPRRALGMVGRPVLALAAALLATPSPQRAPRPARPPPARAWRRSSRSPPRRRAARRAARQRFGRPATRAGGWPATTSPCCSRPAPRRPPIQPGRSRSTGAPARPAWAPPARARGRCSAPPATPRPRRCSRRAADSATAPRASRAPSASSIAERAARLRERACDLGEPGGCLALAAGAPKERAAGLLARGCRLGAADACSAARGRAAARRRGDPGAGSGSARCSSAAASSAARRPAPALGVALLEEGRPGAAARGGRLLTEHCAALGAEPCLDAAEAYLHDAAAALDERAGPALLEAACARGVLDACASLGRLLQEGRAAPADGPRAAALYRRACEGGVERACADLGVLHRFGAGVRATRRARAGSSRGPAPAGWRRPAGCGTIRSSRRVDLSVRNDARPSPACECAGALDGPRAAMTSREVVRPALSGPGRRESCVDACAHIERGSRACSMMAMPMAQARNTASASIHGRNSRSSRGPTARCAVRCALRSCPVSRPRSGREATPRT